MAKILVVDADFTLRELYSEILANAGYDVVKIGDGERALATVKKDWDLLLLDIMLHKIDGLEILKFINSDPTLSKRPVLVISNLDEDSMISRCLELGVCDFLSKSSTTPQDILDTVKEHLK